MERRQDSWLLAMGFQLGKIDAKCDRILEAIQSRSTTSMPTARPSDIMRQRVKAVGLPLLKALLSYITPTLLVWVGAALAWLATAGQALYKWVLPVLRGLLGF